MTPYRWTAFAWHALDEQDRTTVFGVDVDHLTQRWRIGVDDVVRKHDRKRLRADLVLGPRARRDPDRAAVPDGWS